MSVRRWVAGHTVGGAAASTLLLAGASPAWAPASGRPSAEGEAFFELAREGQFVLGPDRRIRRANRSAARILGVPLGEIIGRSLQDFVAPSSAQRLESRFRSADPLATESSPVDLEARGRSGELASHWKAIVAGLPAAAGYVVLLWDTSEEEALVRALAERGAQLARSNRDLQEFTYIASHDLQEPLRMISSYTQLLQRRYHGRFDADADEFLGFAQEGATRLQHLLDDLVTYSRVDARGRPFEPVSMDGCLRDALSNLKVAIDQGGATVVHSPLPSIDGDAVQLTQVFQNLIANAVKFRGPEPPRIAVRGEEDGPFVRYSVVDNGIGVPPEYREKVFVLFQRLHQRDEYPGTGIGLAVCQRIVERHGGTIWVEAAAPSGSAFCFRLPKHPAPAGPPPGALPPAPMPEAARQQAEDLIAERLRELV